MDLSNFDFSAALNVVPMQYQLFIALLIIACKLVTVFVRPPVTGSRWVRPYSIISMIALNVGWAVNALQAGRVRSKTLN